MTLTPEQKQTVAAWLAAGDNLAAVQKKLAEQFKLSLTYMDVRFLVDDLGLELKNAAPKADASDVTKAGSPASRTGQPEKKGFMDKLKEKVGLSQEEEAALPAEEAFEDDAAEADLPPAGTGSVKVEVDRLVRPGAVVSGTVTFSDGTSGKWALDQYGRLMLDTGKKGYQPNAADMQSFQRELSVQLQHHGF
jgi:hypothetical protein